MENEQNLSSDQIKRYSRAFHRFDTDRDGAINGKDLGKILRYIGHNPTEAEVQVDKSFIYNKVHKKCNTFTRIGDQFQLFTTLGHNPSSFSPPGTKRSSLEVKILLNSRK